MRLGFDGHVLTGKFQGTRTTLGNLLKALPRHIGRHELIIYSDAPDEARETVGHDDATYLPLEGHSAVKRLLFGFPRLFHRDRIDIGVFNYITPLVGKSVVFIHDILPMSHSHLFPATFRIRSRLMFALAIRRSVQVVAVSDYTAGAIVRHYGDWVRGKLTTISNGPSFPEEIYFAPREERVPRYVLCVGRIEQRKNVKLLVEAFLDADLADTELFVVGSLDQDYDYSLPDDPRVKNVRGIDDAALIELYRGASLFVYPSQAEGFGLPLLDSVLFGIPTISSNLTAMPEVAGELAEYFDPGALDARDWLAKRIRSHFTIDRVKVATEEQRRARARDLSWDAAATRLMEVVTKIRT
ncbi:MULTISPECIES: glycosyltransferase family 1 protein [unclassified Novosphingobium]|uniref:glycosyltransferase family 4 protein n=1 Tax=unclassified Novosphingobium TaxID=2644732 RepID=UPI00135A95E5|nr:MULTISPECIES: glycosyltransferase family 1 protein [unclassified Novosphingobium]